MSWGAVAGAAVGVIGGALSNKNKGGGAGTTTASKDPWALAQPWIMDNVRAGQLLQNQYASNPFSQQQQAAYANSNAQSDYMRSLVPSLLSQLQGQQVGFDKNNPDAKPTGWDWTSMAGANSIPLNQTNLSGLGNTSVWSPGLVEFNSQYKAR